MFLITNQRWFFLFLDKPKFHSFALIHSFIEISIRNSGQQGTKFIEHGDGISSYGRQREIINSDRIFLLMDTRIYFNRTQNRYRWQRSKKNNNDDSGKSRTQKRWKLNQHHRETRMRNRQDDIDGEWQHVQSNIFLRFQDEGARWQGNINLNI